MPSHRALRSAAVSGLIWVLLLGSASVAAQSAPTPTIVSPIDETHLVQLTGNTPFEPRAAKDQGRVDDSMLIEGIQLQLKRSPSQEAAAEQLADDVNRPGSPHFHQWLTADQFAERFGVSAEDISTLTDWLTSHGFRVSRPSTSRMVITFSGTAGQIREAFHTEIHAFEVAGRRHFANISDPWIPEALAPAVAGIVSLHDFRPRPRFVARQAGPRYTDTPANLHLVVPADLATIYNIDPLFRAGITGKGQTIAVIEDSDMYTEDDWTAFRKAFGLSTYASGSLVTRHPGGCVDPGVNPNLDDFEASVDAEYSTATAPGATIELAACNNTSATPGVLIALQNLLDERHTPSIISISYGVCEPQNGQAANAAIKAAYQQAVLEGISVFVATGDTGAADCDFISSTGGTGGANAAAVFGIAADGYNTTPYNVSVGGTDFADSYLGTVANYWSATNSATYGSALSYVPEIPWNDSCAGTLASGFFGYGYSYGPLGFCNNPSALAPDPALGGYPEALQLTWAGGGGPSTCATGTPVGGSNGRAVVGGTCRGAPKPWWQVAPGNPRDGVRDLPDLSMFAADGYWGHYFVLCYSNPAPGAFGVPCVGDPSNWAGGGGTSFGAPMMAGIQALVNQRWRGRQGNPNPVYYALASLQHLSHANCNATAAGGPARECIFHDITLGDTDVDCVPPHNCYDPGNSLSTPLVGTLSTSNSSFRPAFTAGPGWDFATGLGSVNAANLVNDPIWVIWPLSGPFGQ
jgi:subtilase family serine protease